MAKLKKETCGNKRIWFNRVWIFLGIMLLLIIVSICLFLFLWWLDVKHAEVAEKVEKLMGERHYFSGETWFSVIATCIMSLPGIFCGAFALIQTHRLSKLDARYHRPVLLLREATLKIWKPGRYDTSSDSVDFECYINEKKDKHDVLIKIELEFEVKNEIEVKSFEIEGLTWKTSQDSYSVKALDKSQAVQLYDEKSFWREYNGDRIICHVEKYIELCEIENDNLKQFESAVERFSNYEKRKNDDYKRPEIILASCIEYEYSKEKKEKLECRMQWDAQKDYDSPKEFHTVHKTCDGYFSYDINSRNR